MRRRDERRNRPNPRRAPALGLLGACLLLVACSHAPDAEPQTRNFLIESRPANLVSLWYSDTVSVHRRRVQNVALSPTGDYDFLSGVSLR